MMRETEVIRRKEKIFEGHYLRLERFHVLLPDGTHGHREVVGVKNAVAVLPVDDAGVVRLVRQYRPAIDRQILEIPAGIIDGEETEAEAARRECEEETGYRPRHLKKLITYASAVGYSTGFITLFLGTGLEYTGNIHLDPTEFLESFSLTFDRLMDKVFRNEIIDSKTIVCMLLARDALSGVAADSA